MKFRVFFGRTAGLTSICAHALLLMLSASAANAQVSAAGCGSLANAFGPFEYRADRYKPLPGDNTSYGDKLRLVESGHFTPVVEGLIKGQSHHLVGPDLDYTLRAFPNHHRALVAMMRLWERSKVPVLPGLARPTECYFERAVRFVPDDTTARLIYALFLFKDNRKTEALAQVRITLTHAEDSAFTHYNVGMVLADAGEFDAALAQAHRAMALGFLRTDLKQKLVQAGKWQEPAPASASNPPSAPASAASAAS